MQGKRMVMGALLLAVGSAALALPPQGMERDREQFRQMFDTDKDGKVSRAEMEQAQAEHFARADKDGNGTLSLPEFEAAQEAQRQEMLKRRFTRLDRDADGQVSAEEFKAGQKQHLAALRERCEGKGRE